MRRFIDEYYETPDEQWLTIGPQEIKNFVLEKHNEGLFVSEIVKELQEFLYIFRDEEETQWETKVVQNIIDGKPIINRWTGINFN